jgi:uncharacterized Zn finger protein (UPF0148 family)
MMAKEPSFNPYEDLLEELDIDAPLRRLHTVKPSASSSFVVPERTTMLHARCPSCNGNTYAEHGEIHCMMCNRHLHVSEVSPQGRVTKLSILQIVPRLSRAGYGERSRSARGIARDEGGQTGMAARVLSRIPDAPQYAVVEKIARSVSCTREDVREILTKLEKRGLVERFTFAGGYRTGWRRRKGAPR